MPTRQPRERALRPDTREAPPAPLVLVIEDDPLAADLLAEALTDEGYRVMQTGSAPVGLRLARRHKPAAILLDLLLSEGSGLDLLDGLAASAPTREIPVLVISAAEDLLRHPAALRANATLPKPFSLDSVLRLVQRFVRGEPEPAGRRLVSAL